MNQQRVYSLIAAPFTAMQSDGSIDLTKIPQQAQSLSANGVSGAFVCGTTGEGLSLTMAERMRITEAWRDCMDQDSSLIVHIGHTGLADTQALARHAQEIGADAIGVMAPCFYKPTTVEDLVSYCVEVAATAPDLPFYYYHIPVMTGVQFPMIRFLEAASGKIPTLAGIKFSDENLMDFSLCAQFDNGRYRMLFGRDEILITGLCLGAVGAVGSTYNYAAPLYHRVIDAFQKGDFLRAQAEQVKAQQTVAFLLRFGGLPTGKAIMKHVGLDCGPVRLPLRDLNEEQLGVLEVGLREIGFFEYCSK